ncbi:SDR family NAD(P)-dependent oxidoreductase [Noviherbaspirillum saxi]|uniref:SDR family NAD(P)-dependent oxidoreductase n=1 Tax=Noviherbaspirillum saxi TaxID=2320863 RepID=A0A3A3FZT5_9BURK|nr:SDR family NAD(P)-dependent oxidoreductase [Noviherbaspirillum saxi]RJF92589.1 SDR family NAD(P)-dependent oxidoreductase [Noviherbaspirillum saxi]
MPSSSSCAVVTGAASGIGRGIAYALAARGINLVLSDVDGAGLHAVGTDILQSAPSIKVRQLVTDVSDPHQIELLCERTFSAYGRVDWLYNCAGILVSGPSWELDEAAWKRVLDINLWSAIHTARAFVPRMIAQGFGHIVNVSSLAGLLVGPWLAPYTVSKHGMVALSESMQQEFTALGLPLTMSIVCPGPVQTNIFHHLAQRPAESHVAHANQYLRTLGENGMTPEQLAQIVLDGVDAKKLWIFPHADVLKQSLRSRMETLLAAE